MRLKSEQHTIALTMAYDGATFSGFAQQPGQHTVQGNLNDALKLLYKRSIDTTCAGRTDAGVHALAQVVSFDISDEEFTERSLDTLMRSLNALVDDSIAITTITKKQTGFSARFDARSREYRYFIYTKKVRPVLISERVWHLGKELNLERMKEASQYLIGEHDFKSFCTAVSAEGKPTARYVSEIAISQEQLLGEEVVVIRVIGNAFLHSMVRTMVGTLVAVGLGKHEPSWVKEVLDACDRRAAGENAPAKGLYFWCAFY